MKSRKNIGIYVSPSIDQLVHIVAVKTSRTKSELYELGARLLLDLLTMKTIGTDTMNDLTELQHILEQFPEEVN